jgi:hypothetical protein
MQQAAEGLIAHDVGERGPRHSRQLHRWRWATAGRSVPGSPPH